MKLRRLSAAVLVAVIGAGLVLPAAASASAGTGSDPYLGKGSVTIEGGKIGPGNPTPDPEEPGKPIVPVDPPPAVTNPGNYGVYTVTALDFGTITLGTANASPYAAAAVPAFVIDENGNETTDKTTRGHMINIQDQRGNGLGYTVTANLTQQFTLVGGTAKLDGASIQYTNGIVGGIDGATTFASFARTFTLNQDDGAQTVVGASKDQGLGSYTLEYGQSPDYDNNLTTNPGVDINGTAGTDANSVFLTIPDGAYNTMRVGTYEAVITWNMTSGYTVTP